LLIYVFLSAAVTEVVWEGEETETKKVESQDSKKKAENTAVTNTVNNRSKLLHYNFTCMYSVYALPS
jgi:hypothetical protein